MNATGAGAGYSITPAGQLVDTIVRDDIWNAYTWDQQAGNGHFSWYWLECCTDGMILGVLPTQEAWTYTFFWDLAKTQNMDGGSPASPRCVSSPTGPGPKAVRSKCI